jgi:hypothetical protein
MAERRVEGLQRVLGVYPLASSAYGNRRRPTVAA